MGSLAVLAMAYEVALASTVDDERRERLSQLRHVLVQILAHPELIGPDATSLADARRRAAVALSTDDASTRRLRDAPDGYVLAHEADELARQARLVEPLPTPGTVRVAVSPEGTPDHWIVDVACLDDGRSAGPSRRCAHVGGLRHRGSHCRHLAGRRGRRHVPRPRSRASASQTPRRSDRAHARCPDPEPSGDRRSRRPVRQRRRALAHDMHDHRSRPPRHARCARRRVRRRRRHRAQRPPDERSRAAGRPLRVDRSRGAEARSASDGRASPTRSPVRRLDAGGI